MFPRLINALTVSIHAPREGSDNKSGRWIVTHVVSIHAPREGSDNWSSTSRPLWLVFQSTLPVKGATSRWGRRGL